MRILATALAVMALTVLPVQAGTSTPNTASEQTKLETDAVQLGESQASMPSAQTTAADAKKPTELTAAQTDETAEPKPDQSAQTIFSEHDASPTAN